MANNIYNLIILDKSGSMSSIREEAVNGVNETLGAIRAFVKKNPESKQYVSLIAFCSCGREYILRNENGAETRNLKYEDYEPCCCTPLYDAIGEGCTTLHKLLKGDPDANVSVTIITDGYENASKEWSGDDIKNLIETYRKEGWLFSYIGADHDVEKVAMSLSINNTLRFKKSKKGFEEMIAKELDARSKWMDGAMQCKMSIDLNDNYFDDLDKTDLGSISVDVFE